MDYSLFMEVVMVLMSERVDKCPRATPAAFSSPIFAGTTSVSMFCVSSLPFLETPRGEGLYIGVFRSS
jgi:hypothetical protein